MKYPTIARDFVDAASACQLPLKLNMALKLPSGIAPDKSDFWLKYADIWVQAIKEWCSLRLTVYTGIMCQENNITDHNQGGGQNV